MHLMVRKIVSNAANKNVTIHGDGQIITTLHFQNGETQKFLVQKYHSETCIYHDKYMANYAFSMINA